MTKLHALVLTAALNLVAFVGGAVALSIAFGWAVGLGVAALVYFHKIGS